MSYDSVYNNQKPGNNENGTALHTELSRYLGNSITPPIDISQDKTLPQLGPMELVECAQIAPPLETVPRIASIVGEIEAKEAIENGKWPDTTDGIKVLKHTLTLYLIDHEEDFLNEYIKWCNKSLKGSDLEGKIQFGMRPLTEADRKNLAQVEKESTLRFHHGGIIELRDTKGNVTDSRVVTVFAGLAGRPDMFITKKSEKP